MPDHTTLSRRGLRLETDRRADAGDGVDLVIDSTGLRLWRRGSPPGRTGWRKLHIAIDPNTGTILAEALTDGDVHDTQAVPGLLSRIGGRIDRVYGDGACDGALTYRLLADRRQALPIPQGVFRPRAPSIAVADAVDPLGQRGRHLRFIAQHGRRAWERDTGYGRRNLLEATFSRLKRVLGNRLCGRSLPAQRVRSFDRHPSSEPHDRARDARHRAGCLEDTDQGELPPPPLRAPMPHCCYEAGPTGYGRIG